MVYPRWPAGARCSVDPAVVKVGVVVDSVKLMLADLTSRYAEMPASEAFARLYADDAQFGHIFASLHERLNQHFDSINGRAKTTKHYWADVESRHAGADR